ncbi:circadian clock protein KaiC [Dictyobacter sp. S3.2.2.5]|uniref:non-specific serine/threonine protein kinase n=1 Tax=Dictyobacter halimunensis TaxID=3026934 RepID=A0ABQ6G754_9CHLR|nr:circadian clock protein KaiC [Dictyobacter sp. S3.2.2.5]
MTESLEQPFGLRQFPTGIAGLDRVLSGGLFIGGNYMVMGPPGAGKTILGNQLCFHHIASGGRALYLSLLAETSSRLLATLERFTFYTPDALGDTITYFSGSSALEKGGLEELLQLIRTETRRLRATLLVLDGTTVLEGVSSQQDWIRFLYGLYVSAEITECTTILLMQTPQSTDLSREQTIMEGLIELAMPAYGMRAARELRVRKFRGSGFLEGRHSYAITEAGIVVHPRTEELLAAAQIASPGVAATAEQESKKRIGPARLDDMMRGGLPADSITLLLGASGTGKTLLGSHFLLANATQREPALYFGFSERPSRLERKLARFGLDITHARAEGHLEVLWQSPLQPHLDVSAERLLEAIRRGNIRQLFIDGLGGWQRAIGSAERLDLFLTALFSELQALNVTTMCSVELPALFSPTLELPMTVSGIADLADNLIFLRYVELESQLYRLLSILKMRESDYDPAIREFRITNHGIDVAPTFASAQAILTGVAVPLSREEQSKPFPAKAEDAEGRQP